MSSCSEKIESAVLSLAQAIATVGGRAYVVGGAVRDALLGGIAVKDLDLEVYGLKPDKLRQIVGERFAYDECGVSYGVLKLKGFDIDVSLPRRETKCGRGHRAFEIEANPFLPIAEAAARRDFTINAIYRDALTGEIIDPFGGVADLKAHRLKHVSPRFVEDPLRVLRGMQFIARFGLSSAPETIAVSRTMDFEGLAPERVFGEWEKFFVKGERPLAGLEFLRETGWTRHFPELHALIGCGQDPSWHPEGDVWQHTLLALEAFARQKASYDDEENLIVGLAVLCHDFGKPATTAFDPVKGRIRSLGHDEAGVKPTLEFLRRITRNERILKEVPPLVRCHMRPFSMWKSGASEAAVRRLSRDVVRIDRLLRVARADEEGRPDLPHKAAPEIEWLAATAERLRVADSAPVPIVKGRDLIAMGIAPGPELGRILSLAYEAQLDGRLVSPADLRKLNLVGDSAV